MKLLQRISEADMVAAFLKGELQSPRFSSQLKKAMQLLGATEGQIACPDTTNTDDNELRAKILGEYRGYGHDRWLFGGVPHNLNWYQAELMRDEIGALRYVDYGYWNELSGHTHLVKDGVANIQEGKIVFDVPNDGFLTVASAICQGKHDFEPIILWGKTIDSLEILEGHLRATAFGLAGDKAPTTLPAIIGIVDPHIV
jgi:hypothetical protein